jgi:ADP-ribose pyrophosphatase
MTSKNYRDDEGVVQKVITPWKRLESELNTASRYRALEDVLFELPDGRHEWYTIKQDPTVVSILALTPEQQVILTRQFRPGPNRVLDELPGGSIEPDERAIDAATRELLEETGYQPREMMAIGELVPDAFSTMVQKAFVALDCVWQTPPQLDETEFIQVVLKPLPEFLQQLQSGLCTDSDVAWMGLYHAGIINLVS